MLKDEIKKLSRDFHSDIIGYRRHLHANPELSFEEHETSAYVKARLDEMGISWKPVAGTGILAVIEGKPSLDVVALRADMDALPIQEANKVEYASRVPGVMHACGHDFHTSSLLGTARILQALCGQFKGKVKLMFQPAEEVLPGGASLMIKEGVLENPTPHAVI